MMRLNAFTRKCVNLTRQRKSTLSCFLSETKARLSRVARDDHVVFIMGNQAADADSVVSALVLSYVKSLNDRKSLYVPLVSASRDIFVNTHPLEPFLLRPAVEVKELIFLEDVIDMMKDLNSDRMEIVLTDHNKLAPGLHETFGDAVVEIYDHHADQNCYEGVRVRKVVFDEKTCSGLGSCCTILGSLVDVEKICGNTENEIARMLLDVILVDTVGLRPEAGKTKPLDLEIAKKLNDIVNVDISKRFGELSDAKFDPSFWKARSTMQLLKYDFKKYRIGDVVYGASSIPITIRDLVEKENSKAFQKNALQWMKQNSLEFLLLVSMTMSGDIANRELGLCSTQKDTTKLTSYLKDTDLQLKKQSISGSGSFYFEAFSQGNRKRSRKRITPLVDEYLMNNN
eukprot:g7432.t1